MGADTANTVADTANTGVMATNMGAMAIITDSVGVMGKIILHTVQPFGIVIVY